jgi:hypothetical protein
MSEEEVLAGISALQNAWESGASCKAVIGFVVWGHFSLKGARSGGYAYILREYLKQAMELFALIEKQRAGLGAAGVQHSVQHGESSKRVAFLVRNPNSEVYHIAESSRVDYSMDQTMASIEM